MSIPLVKLGDGNKMPALALGLWKNKDREECINSVKWAVEAGYRHFDTAQAYGNEEYLSEGLAAAGLSRQDAFITTKIRVENFLRVEQSFKKSLASLKTDYVDLLLLHFPVTMLRRSAWRHLEKIHGAGGARSIGVSNYTVKHLEELLAACKIKPVVNQVELHVFLQQPELIKFCHDNDIIVEAYSPLAHGHGIDDPMLVRIGQKHGKTPTQVMIRWCIEVGTVPLPKSTHQERLKQNIDVFDFKLAKADMAELAKLNKNLRTCWDPTRVP